jgi:hypothetical protein
MCVRLYMCMYYLGFNACTNLKFECLRKHNSFLLNKAGLLDLCVHVQ